MRRLRQLVRDYRQIALLIAALGIMAKALVPAGYMIDHGARVLTVAICADASGAAQTTQIVLPASEKRAGHAPSGSPHDGQTKGTCAWSVLAMGALGGGDAAVLALLLAFILMLGFAPTRPITARRIAQLRPPLRGPPALA